MTNLNPYLSFKGNCEEAMTFYKECLGGEIVSLNHYGDSPVKVPDGYDKKVMHAALKFEGSLLMASDIPQEHEVTNGNSISLTIGTDDVNKADEFFNKLSAGGKIIMPMQETFWAARFGMLADKYGINWMINCEVKK